MIEFVLLKQEHIQQIAALETFCFSVPWSADAISGELSNPLSVWYVAVEDDRVAGYVGSQAVLDEADMMNLAVAPKFRRKGVAKDLVAHLIQHLKEQNVRCLTLEVRASNEAAIALYDALGFSCVGRRPGYYHKPREDALIFRKEWDI